MLRLRDASIPELEQMLVSETLRPLLLHLSYHSNMAGHPSRMRLLALLRWTYYWPLMAIGISSTVQSFSQFSRNGLRLIRRKKAMHLFLAKKPL